MIGSNNDVTTLNSLIATTIDSINGYQESADAVENRQFRELFQELARDRQGGNPEDDGTTLAAAHRTFVDLKSAITGRDDKAVINEVERGEDHIKDKYEAALNDSGLSAEARQVVQESYQSVRRGHDRVRDLKHALEGTNA
jgi:uncharacterized protein (TIGR02284 family)